MRLGTLLAAARLEAAVVPACPPGGAPAPGRRAQDTPYSQVPGRSANTPGADADARETFIAGTVIGDPMIGTQ